MSSRDNRHLQITLWIDAKQRKTLKIGRKTNIVSDDFTSVLNPRFHQFYLPNLSYVIQNVNCQSNRKGRPKRYLVVTVSTLPLVKELHLDSN